MCALFSLRYSQMILKKVCWLLEKLDILRCYLKTVFVPVLVLLTDIWLRWLLFLPPYSIIVIILCCLELTELLLQHGVSNFSAPVEFIIQQFTDKLSIRFISQLIKGTSKFLQKSLKHFNDPVISVSFVFPVADVAPFILALNLNESESVIISLGSSSWYS